MICKRPLRNNIVSAAFAAVAALASTAVLAGEHPDSKLQEVERAIEAGRERAGALEAEAEHLDHLLKEIRRKSVDVARAVQGFESRQAELETRLKDLDIIAQETSVKLEARRAQFMVSLMALQRMARHPPEALMAQPTSPDDTVRSAILLRGLVPEIESRAKALRDDLAALSEARLETAAKKNELELTSRNLDAERDKMERLLKEKAALRAALLEKSADERRRVAKLAEEAKSLKDLLAKIEERRRLDAEKTREEERRLARLQPKAKPQPPKKPELTLAPPVQGDLPQPVVGDVVEAFGAVLDTGLKAKGVRIQARPNSQVIAPHEGVVVFAGVFRGYGQLLIIEHGEGYHTLLAGMSRIDGIIGQEVLAGEPVGIMGGPDERDTKLYFELRKKGQPINPIPWLAARNHKVSG